ncbi:arginine--tRNA ligase [Desulfatitalea alkaliphila]|uniref:Arginine--tRNA ligase n=1 Tax=Desulfatitalea alkaliphila TaxID=2929485 RepID=A0AA41R4Z7_9BACT|nr:arginine--tRNA ligase [Desulfatitalea alkaliphila]MCJ8499358.1 arginine--tRNA ligase [Desulfatitalea alkaliphila]
MKSRIQALILDAARQALAAGALTTDQFPEVLVEEPKNEGHGDFATNFAMLSAKTQKMAPRKIAQALVDHLGDGDGLLERTEIAGPGFVNFFLQPVAWPDLVRQVLAADHAYGTSDIGAGEKVQVEFVSANPTGPLHVGHGRGAAVGDSVARILACCGYDVQREYYINDSGRQIQTLGRSVYLRMRELQGEIVEFPSDCYQGDYIRDLARELSAAEGDGLREMDEAAAIGHCARYAARSITDGIRRDLENFGVRYDRWFSEQSLYDSGRVDQCLNDLKARGIVYAAEGAWWFKTSDLGDEKDRVVVRQNGQTTYFASDIAYHIDKYQRGFDRVIDVWGADHHGYIPRMSAAVEAAGHGRDRFQVILVQLVNLLRGGQPVAMSTRSGEFVTLEEVVAEVGADAARFIFLTRDYDSPLDFDLETAKQKSNDNPVYYVQYVHARIASILRKAAEQGIPSVTWAQRAGERLIEAEEIQLIKALARYPEVVAMAAHSLAPHRIPFYLMQLAALFHAYYNKHRVLTDDPDLTMGRLCLVLAVQKVIRNGLGLLAVGAPEQM